MVGEHVITELLEGWQHTYSSETEFIEHLTTECLSSKSSFLCGCTFWTPEEHEPHNIIIGNVSARSIREKIRDFLTGIVMSHDYGMDLAQFWAPKEVEGRSILTTLHQPFAIGYYLYKGLSWHRKKCMEHHYNVERGADEEQLGPPGRVFRNGHPESSPNIRDYSAKSFPLRDHAAHCGVRSYLALPIFGLQNNECFGVLEIFGTEFRSCLESLSLSNFCKALEALELRTTDMIGLGGKTNLSKSVDDYHDQHQVNDTEKMVELSLNGYDDERYTTSGSGENTQIPETDYLNNVEKEENIIDINSNEGNKRVKSTSSFDISYADLEAHFGKKQDIAADDCGVSKSTFKRKCKELGIKRWPNVKNKRNPSLFKTKTPQKPVQNSDHQISKPSSCKIQISDFPINSNVPNTCTESTQEVDKTCQDQTIHVVMIKAKFKKDIVKFKLCLSSGLKKVEEEVAKRLSLMIGNFELKYKDDDGHTVSLKCDEDLHLYVESIQSLGYYATNQIMQVHLVSN